MDWEHVKYILSELEEVILKLFVVISLILVIIEILTRKISELISAWRNKSTTSMHD